MAAGLPSWSPCWAARSPCTPPKRFGRPDVLASQAMTPAPSSPHAIPAGVHVVSSRKEARQSDTRKSQPKPSWSDAQMRLSGGQRRRWEGGLTQQEIDQHTAGEASTSASSTSEASRVRA
ncbi:unnamed protein product [Durusdinium trenchii]|uniref:Uncharacterized protein n=1 Tax=Durusdinium trenchii TaxID=1381693 RepID=A0ABP0S8P6_9DINO